MKLIIPILLVSILLMSGCIKRDISDSQENIDQCKKPEYYLENESICFRFDSCLGSGDSITSIENNTHYSEETSDFWEWEKNCLSLYNQTKNTTIDVYKVVCEEYDRIICESCYLIVDGYLTVNNKCHVLGATQFNLADSTGVCWGNKTDPFLDRDGEDSTGDYKCIKEIYTKIGNRTLSPDGIYWIFTEDDNYYSD